MLPPAACVNDLTGHVPQSNGVDWYIPSCVVCMKINQRRNLARCERNLILHYILFQMIGIRSPHFRGGMEFAPDPLYPGTVTPVFDYSND